MKDKSPHIYNKPKNFSKEYTSENNEDNCVDQIEHQKDENQYLEDVIKDQEELSEQERTMRLENEDAKEDAQRRMAWVALISMVIFPIVILGCSYFDLANAIKILGEISGPYFMSSAAIVMAFFGKEAYIKNGQNNRGPKRF